MDSLIRFSFCVLLAVMLNPLFACAQTAVLEPPLNKRHIELKLMHPQAATNPVKRFRVEQMNAGQLRQLLKKNKGIWEDAALDCQGGYNPISNTPGGPDYLAFDIANAKRGESDLFLEIRDDRSVHDICMIKAFELSKRLSQQNRLPR